MSYLKIGGIIIGSILGLTVLSSVMGIFSSVVTAPGRVIQKTMETNNIIQSYEWFYDVNAAYIARSRQIEDFNGWLTDDSNDKQEKRRLQIEVSAVRQSCRDLVTKYNANSEKMNKSIFKGWSLPQTLSVASCG